MSGRKTVLIVDDDPGILRVLSDGLSSVLDLFDVATASNGLEAIQELERRSVDVLVTDLAMPVMDGFALIAYVTNQRSALPVVVLSGMVGSMLDQRLAGYGGLRVLRKPASYQEVAACVLEEIERVDRGLIEGIPLSGVLQLIEAERRSSRVVVTSGRRRGQLDFESGRLVNAFSDDFGAEGEAAAYDILGWSDTSIEFEPLPANVRRLIHTPMQLLLVEVAAAQDRSREGDAADAPLGDPAAGSDGGPNDGATPADDAHDDREAATEDVDPVATPDADADDAGPGPVAGDAADLADAAFDAVAAVDAETPADATAWADGNPPTDGTTSHAAAFAEVDDHERVDDSILLDAPTPAPAVPEASRDDVSSAAATEALGDPDGVHDEAATPAVPAPPAPPAAPAPAATPAVPAPPAPPAAPAPAATPAVPAPPAPPDAPAPAATPRASSASDAHVEDMLAAIERLAQRAKTADDALAAVASEIEAFRQAQRRFDEANAQREQRRRDLERFRDEVAQLAREILGRVDGLFDAMASDPAPRDVREERPAT